MARNLQGQVVRLNELKPGESGVVVDIDMASPRNKRLIAMGIVPGTWLMVRKLAPLGDPMEIRLRNYQLSLRKQTAARVKIERSPVEDR